MRIIISPAKKMISNTDILEYRRQPRFVEDTVSLLSYLQGLSYEDIKSIWKCNDSIAKLNYERIKHMDLYKNLTPALLSYEGIQYQYMAPHVLEGKDLEYLDEHLRILSGFYGVLAPFDGVTPYRLEMQATLTGWHVNSLYQFWTNKVAQELFLESDCIINLASKEYSKCVLPYLHDKVSLITCVFGEFINGKVVEKGTLAKMARGEMVRFMAMNQIKNCKEIKRFKGLGYVFKKELSNETTYVFIKEK